MFIIRAVVKHLCCVWSDKMFFVWFWSKIMISLQSGVTGSSSVLAGVPVLAP